MTEPVTAEKSTGDQKPRRGRKAGVPNKASIARQAAIAASGLTPLDYMLKQMRNAKLPPDMRLDAARSAAPYVHPKLAQTQITGEMTVKAELKSELLDKLVALVSKVKLA